MVWYHTRNLSFFLETYLIAPPSLNSAFLAASCDNSPQSLACAFAHILPYVHHYGATSFESISFQNLLLVVLFLAGGGTLLLNAAFLRTLRAPLRKQFGTSVNRMRVETTKVAIVTVP